MDTKDKIALITGASKGIGKATAMELAKKGASIIINYNSDENSAKKVLEECNQYSKNNTIIKADITKENEVEEMFKIIKEKYKKVDILINNAGIFDESDSPTNLKVFEKIFSMNFLAQIRITKFSLELMKEGKIVNISSIYGRLGQGEGYAAAYGSMKAALDHYTKTLARDLAPKILVNAIAPGKTITPMWGKMSGKEKQEIGKTQLINRFIYPEEIAKGILFLIKNDAICGEILTTDGGMSLKKS